MLLRTQVTWMLAPVGTHPIPYAGIRCRWRGGWQSSTSCMRRQRRAAWEVSRASMSCTRASHSASSCSTSVMHRRRTCSATQRLRFEPHTPPCCSRCKRSSLPTAPRYGSGSKVVGEDADSCAPPVTVSSGSSLDAGTAGKALDVCAHVVPACTRRGNRAAGGLCIRLARRRACSSDGKLRAAPLAAPHRRPSVGRVPSGTSSHPTALRPEVMRYLVLLTDVMRWGKRRWWTQRSSLAPRPAAQ
jgi:hypothetical protein